MVDQLIKHSSIRFDCKIADTMEERRSRWTTYRHISVWFNQWEVDLVELGFGSHDATGKLVLPLHQLRRIINIIFDRANSKRSSFRIRKLSHLVLNPTDSSVENSEQ